MASLLETAVSSIITDLEGITVENGYRNDAIRVGKVFRSWEQLAELSPGKIEITVSAGNGEISPVNTAVTVFQEEVAMGVFAYIKVSDETGNELYSGAESAIKDIVRKLSSVCTAHINDATGKWFILNTKPMYKIFRALVEERNYGMIGVFFKIRILAETDTFEALI